MVEHSNSTRQQTGTFKVTSGINRPRHVFIWSLNDESDNVQNLEVGNILKMNTLLLQALRGSFVIGSATHIVSQTTHLARC